MSVFTSDVTVEAGSTNLPVNVQNFPATQPVSGTVTATQATGSNLHVVVDSGTVTTTSGVGSTATVTQVVLTNNTNATLLAANVNRKAAIIFIPSSTLQVKYGAVASLTSFTYKITTNSTTLTIHDYTGQIDAFGMNQTVNVTEVV